MIRFFKSNTLIKFDSLIKIILKKSFIKLFAGNNNNMSKRKQVEERMIVSYKEVSL